MQKPIRIDDASAMLNHVGSLPLGILRESVDHGFFLQTLSRRQDPTAFADYTDCTKANMMYDRIAGVARGLILAAGVPDLFWQVSANKRATEIMMGPWITARIKRVKRNRGGMPTSVGTGRQVRLESPRMYLCPGQQLMDFSGWLPPCDDEDRCWLTVAFDLDETEESVSRVDIGVVQTIKNRKRFLWKAPLLPTGHEVLARISPSVAEQVEELRQRRLA